MFETGVTKNYTFCFLKGIPLFLTVLEGVCVALVMSHFDLSLASYRSMILFLSFMIMMFSKISLFSYYPLLLTNFLSFFLFANAFVIPTEFMRIKGSFILNIVQINLNMVLTVIWCLLFAIYSSYIRINYSYLVYTFPRGLLSYLKNKIMSTFKNMRSIFILTFLSCLFIYFNLMILNNTIGKLLILIRFRLFFPGLISSMRHILGLCISTLFYYFDNVIYEGLVNFNRSYILNPEITKMEQSKEGMRFWFHNLRLVYSKQSVNSSKYGPLSKSYNSLKHLQSYIDFEISQIVSILESMRTTKNIMTSAFYISVPQVNKNYSKKYRAFSICETIKNKIKYEVEMHMLLMQYYNSTTFMTNLLEFLAETINDDLGLEYILKTDKLIGDIQNTENIVLKDLSSKNYSEIYGKLVR